MNTMKRTSTTTNLNGKTIEIDTEPGWRTSEFWLNILILVMNFVLFILDRVPVEWWMTVSAGQAGLYSLSRGIRKR